MGRVARARCRLAVAGPGGATLVRKPVTKGLGHGAVYQPRLDKRSCYGSSPSVKLGSHRCTTLTQLTNASAETKPAVGPRRYLAYAKLDEDISREAAPWIPLGNNASYDFVSHRVGARSTTSTGSTSPRSA